MKQQITHPHLLRRLIIAGGILVSLILLYTIPAYTLRLWPFTEGMSTTETDVFIDNNPSAPPLEESGKQSKEDLIKQSEENTPLPIPTSDDISVSTNQESNGNLTILTKLYGYSDGTCDVSISNGQNIYTASVEIIFQAEYATCAGFSVPRNELGTGKWNIELTVTTGDQEIVKKLSAEVQ